MRKNGIRVAVLLVLSAMAAGAAPAAPVGEHEGLDCDASVRLMAETRPPLPVGALVPCPGIRPGAVIRTPAGSCSANFLFHGTRMEADGTEVDEGLFLGTAGHCIDPACADLDAVWADGEGLAVLDHAFVRIGETAAAICRNGLDFALVRIDAARAAEAEPAMCHFGGPVGFAPTLPRRSLVHHFGQGAIGFGRTVPGRTGLVDHYVGGMMRFTGAAAPGDSGSGVIDAQGRAIGTLVTLHPGAAPGIVGVTTLESHLPLVAERLGLQLELVTAPLAP